MQNGLRKYLSFGTNNRLIFIDNFQFFPIGFSLDNLVKTLSKEDFKYLTQEFIRSY